MMFYLTGDIRYTIATAIVYHFLINYIMILSSYIKRLLYTFTILFCISLLFHPLVVLVVSGELEATARTGIVRC